MSIAVLSGEVLKKMREADVLVPAPLAVNEEGRLLEDQQKLLTRYYLEAGASSVIPGTHTGQFSRGDVALFRDWMQLTSEVVDRYRDPERVFRMAAVGGGNAMEMLRAAADAGYEIALVAPTSFVSREGRPLAEEDALCMLRDMAEVLPVYGFYLQQAVGGRDFSRDFWSGMFEFAWGAKAAPFSRPNTDVVMQAALESGRLDELVMCTGNDDYIVGDLLNRWSDGEAEIRFTAGLLGHFATDTRAAGEMVRRVKKYRTALDSSGETEMTPEEMTGLAADVTAMNYAVFDTMTLPGSPAYENCVYGVHYRLSRLGLIFTGCDIRWSLPGGGVRIEKGRPGLDKEIDIAYRARPHLTDDSFVSRELVSQWKSELDIG